MTKLFSIKIDLKQYLTLVGIYNYNHLYTNYKESCLSPTIDYLATSVI